MGGVLVGINNRRKRFGGDAAALNKSRIIYFTTIKSMDASVRSSEKNVREGAR